MLSIVVTKSHSYFFKCTYTLVQFWIHNLIERCHTNFFEHKGTNFDSNMFNEKFAKNWNFKMYFLYQSYFKWNKQMYNLEVYSKLYFLIIVNLKYSH